MTRTYDLLVRDTYLPDRDGVFDVGVRDGAFDAVEPELDDDADVIVEADGNLLSPAFVDCHKHLDRGLAATGGRRPAGNDEPLSRRPYVELFDEYYQETPRDVLVDRIVENVEMAVAAGTTRIRSHVTVDHSLGTEIIDTFLEAAERTADLVDLELVVATTAGLEEREPLVREAIETAHGELPVFVGGHDGRRGIRERGRQLERWFDLAVDYGVGVDVHITARGELGAATLEELAALADEYDYGGRVTAIHAYALAMVSDWRLREVADALEAAGVNVVTCFNSTRSSMPVQELHEAGVTLAHGTDNDRDFVVPHGNADPLEAAQLLSLKLNYGPEVSRSTPAYRWYDTNPALELLWELLTEQGGAALGVEDYGVREGSAADFVVFDAPSPEWAIVDRAERTYVVKDGRIVARDGTVRPSSD